uniref:non-specific serine/threonine protein kinase n=1 Tax=Heterorhabditis bacteriophora TaxID=37862 RepID=A0A1I7X0P4_HETBA
MQVCLSIERRDHKSTSLLNVATRRLVDFVKIMKKGYLTVEEIKLIGSGSYRKIVLLICICAVIIIVNYTFNVEIHFQARVQRDLSRINPHIVLCLGYQYERIANYTEMQILMEYIEGGDLFELAVPSQGLNHSQAQDYFRQLLKGLDFIHEMDIAHRDIKPENLLLSKRGVVKITDFGLCEKFRIDGEERILTRSCGTPAYMSPDVIRGHYRGQPSDIWSAGIVLITLLTGDLPWRRAVDSCVNFKNWKSNAIELPEPFERMGMEAMCRFSFTFLFPLLLLLLFFLALLRFILNNNEETRPSIAQILQHPWMTCSHFVLLVPLYLKAGVALG